MKKIYVAAAFLIAGISSNAQTVLLMQDFQGDLSIIQNTYPSVLSTDTDWYNYDEDGLADASPSGRPGEWFLVYPWAIADSLTGTGDTNVCLAANSWTNNFSTPVKNWLITSSVMIPSTATSAVLKFKTAPYQTPLYLDGFTVRISTTTNDLAAFGAPVFTAAEYSDEGGAYINHGSDFANYVWDDPYTPTADDGASDWIHGWDGSTLQMSELEDNGGDSSRWNGILTMNTVDLSSYIGQNIFVAIVHETHDDNLLAVDDISIEAITEVEGTNAVKGVKTYPNPSSNMITIDFAVENASPAIVKVTDMMGRVIYTTTLGFTNVGANKINLDISGYANGTYHVDIQTDMGLGKTTFIKN
jgi:hypothetical protein